VQGLQSGNYTFQVKAIDAAGNVGAATQPYAFAVDDALPLPGAGPAGAAAWFSGWHVWVVVAGGGAAVLLLAAALTAAAAAIASRHRRLERLRSDMPTSPAGAFAAAAEDVRVRAAILQSLEVSTCCHLLAALTWRSACQSIPSACRRDMLQS
jgi:hypothetical protein